MVIAHMSGGFGNQLFSFAFGYALAKERGEKFCIDTAIQDTDWFFRNPDIMKMNIQYDRRISYKIGQKVWERGPLNKLRFRNAIGWKTKIILEKDLERASDWRAYCRLIPGDIYVKGNWSMELSFLPVRDDILSMYTFKEPLSTAANNIAREIKKTPNSVGIHYRRGDYVKIGICINPEYFINAMKEMTELIENPVFYVFSEDTMWVKEVFRDLPYDIRFPEYESKDKGIEDFRLLSMCNHQINSNSSYSWWAAYLNKNVEKKVMVPCDYGMGWPEELYPANWLKRPFKMLGKETTE